MLYTTDSVQSKPFAHPFTQKKQHKNKRVRILKYCIRKNFHTRRPVKRKICLFKIYDGVFKKNNPFTSSAKQFLQISFCTRLLCGSLAK